MRIAYAIGSPAKPRKRFEIRSRCSIYKIDSSASIRFEIFVFDLGECFNVKECENSSWNIGFIIEKNWLSMVDEPDDKHLHSENKPTNNTNLGYTTEEALKVLGDEIDKLVKLYEANIKNER